MSTPRMPAWVFRYTGKTTASATRNTFGVSPTPSQMITSGSSPRIGTARGLQHWVKQVLAEPEQTGDDGERDAGRKADGQAHGHPLQGDKHGRLQRALGPEFTARVDDGERGRELEGGEDMGVADRLPCHDHQHGAGDAPHQPWHAEPGRPNPGISPALRAVPGLSVSSGVISAPDDTPKERAPGMPEARLPASGANRARRRPRPPGTAD
jgi:hypothetical protein